MSDLLMIGTDSEYFVQKDGVIGSAIGLLHGDKTKPFLVRSGNLQEDNVLAEFAINPAKTKQEFLTNISVVKYTLEKTLQEQGYSVVAKSSHFYEKEELLSFGEKAMHMGCEADFDVYADTANPKPRGQTCLRTAAGHVHFSYVGADQQTTKNIIKVMDYLLGLWSLHEDEDQHRREMYGKAGSCRLKVYGGEYRALGNFWLRTEEMRGYVYDMTEIAVERHEELLLRFQTILPSAELQAIINGYDFEAAKIFYPLILRAMEEVVCSTI